MALKLTIPFPIFVQPPSANPNPNLSSHRPSTEVNFARWNNAHYEKFNQRQRAQQEIEDEIRRRRRFNSATKIAEVHDSESTTDTNGSVVFKSIGTPSSPSKPSIPGKKSKYSKPPKPDDHPAFRRVSKPTKIANLPREQPVNPKAKLSVSEDGVSYVIDGAPFEFKYSYTETPKVKPLKLREAPYAPFGPTTMSRPWTGRAPLPPSKKKLKEFDSFTLPPPGKKGVKPVQKPGPYLPGTGPRYVYTRDQILGEPLTEEEVEELIHSCIKTNRQLNMGRDGLTHNMLDNIHAHWKRRRVCKIKCKGVCTVDMDNVCQQLEERTGGKIIFRRGGVLYLFRGRNYNYRTRPRFPLMLWKPITPVYPRLIQLVPEGLTLEEASEMRKKGRNLLPICKLGKNGVYCNLVKNVREAFEECELVRINCQGMNGSDYRKIGAKLKDLVPCVLISFEREHILMWRGQDWKSSLPQSKNDFEEGKELEVDAAISVAPPVEEGDRLSASCTVLLSVKDSSPDSLNTNMPHVSCEDVHAEQTGVLFVDDAKPLSSTGAISNVLETNETTLDDRVCSDDEVKSMGNISGDVNKTYGGETILDSRCSVDEEPVARLVGSVTILEVVESTGNQSDSSIMGSLNHDQLHSPSEISDEHSEPSRLSGPRMEKVLFLMKQAVESGSAIVLDDATLDADIVYEKSVAFAKSATPGPVFSHRFKKVAVQKSGKEEAGISEVNKESEILQVKKEAPTVSEKREIVRPTERRTKSLNDEDFQDVAVKGGLKIDELAKLLA